MQTIPDSNVVLDILQPEQEWFDWSSKHLEACLENGSLIVNAVIFAEISGQYLSHRDVQQALFRLGVKLEDIPWEAAHLADRAHRAYRHAGGRQERLLPDFLIGSHASLRKYRLLTRDQARYRTYFPDLDIIAPDSHP